MSSVAVVHERAEEHGNARMCTISRVFVQRHVASCYTRMLACPLFHSFVPKVPIYETQTPSRRGRRRRVEKRRPFCVARDGIRPAHIRRSSQIFFKPGFRRKRAGAVRLRAMRAPLRDDEIGASRRQPRNRPRLLLDRTPQTIRSEHIR